MGSTDNGRIYSSFQRFKSMEIKLRKQASGQSATEINYIANNEFDADRVDVKSLTGWECSDSTDGSVNGNVKSKTFLRQLCRKAKCRHRLYRKT